MKKIIGITIFIMVALILGGFAYAQSGSQYNTNQNIPAGATQITFTNNGNTWVHAVIVFENMVKQDGTTGNIYADMWLKPKVNGVPGTAIIDLSNLAGYGNNPIPAGTQIKMNTWGNLLGTSGGYNNLKINLNTESSDSKINTIEKSNLPVLSLPQGITDNKITTTVDPTSGAEYLSNLQSSEGSNWNIAKLLDIESNEIIQAQTLEQAVLCQAAGGEEEVPKIASGENNVQGLASSVQELVSSGSKTIPLQKTGMPAVLAVLSIFLVIGGLLYKKLVN